jgi:uncharacterized protein YkwD
MIFSMVLFVPFCSVAPSWDYSQEELADFGAVANTTRSNNSRIIPAAQGQSFSQKDFIAEVVRLVNVNRKENGVPALKAYTLLIQAANIRANELCESFSHTRPSGKDFYSVFNEVPLKSKGRASAENIAMGQISPAEVMDSWMNSKGHRANILSNKYIGIGVGIATCSKKTLGWVQLFIG